MPSRMRAILNQDGRAELFHLVPGGKLEHRWQYRPKFLAMAWDWLMEFIRRYSRYFAFLASDRQPAWSQWNVLGDGVTGYDVIRRPTGELQIFYVAGRQLWTRRQAQPNSGWTDPRLLADDAVDCAASLNSQGRFDLFYQTYHVPGNYRIREDDVDVWSAPRAIPIPAPLLGVPHQRSNGFIDLFYAPAPTLQLLRLTEQDDFNTRTPIAPDFSPFVIEADSAGRISLFGSGVNWNPQWIIGTAAGNAFAAAVPLIGNDGFGPICAAINPEGMYEIFLLRRSDHALQRITQLPGSNVSVPETFALPDDLGLNLAELLLGFCVVKNGSGKLDFFVRASNATWTRREESIGQWSGWRRLP